jgi:hypothetical protein
MTMPTALPFGLRDVKLIPFTDETCTELEDILVDLPYSRTFSFTEAEDFEDLRGDDELVTSHGSNAWVEWELESGGISLEAWAVLSGGQVTVEGVAPNIVKTYRKLTSTSKPSFMVIGQSISDSGGDMHCVVYRAKITDSLEGEFGDQAFFLTSGSGKGYGSRRPGETGFLYDFVQHQTAMAIIAPELPETEVQELTITGTPTAGTFTLSLDGHLTAGIPYNAAASAVEDALEALPNVEAGDVVCTGGPLPGSAVVITFGGQYAGDNMPTMVASGAGLTGGTDPAANVSTTTEGGS